MPSKIDYSTIGWEQFEDLCIALWFKEGYREIRPYGRRSDGGRDAVYINEETGDLTLFQFKQWTSSYSSSDIRSMVKKAAEKVGEFNPIHFILNCPLPPNAQVNDWIPEFANEIGFTSMSKKTKKII